MCDQEGWKDHTNKTRTEKGLILYNFNKYETLDEIKIFLREHKGSKLVQKEMADLSRSITRDKELRSQRLIQILIFFFSDPDFMTRSARVSGTSICQTIGNVAAPNQSWEACGGSCAEGLRAGCTFRGPVDWHAHCVLSW